MSESISPQKSDPQMVGSNKPSNLGSPAPEKKDQADNNKQQQVEQASYALVDGEDISNVDPALIPDIRTFLRKYKAQVLEYPDYATAKRIEIISKQLLLINSDSMYSSIQNEKIQVLEKKLNETRKQREEYQNKRLKARQDYENRLAQGLEKIKKQQAEELDKLDAKFDIPLPASHRKLSGQVMQIRMQEKYMRSAGMYDEAAQFKEEGDALEAYELEVQKQKWENEWRIQRSRLQAQQNRIIQNYYEKEDTKWQTIEPEYVKKDSYFEKVISNLESQIQREKGFVEESKRETTASVNARQTLPKLGMTNRSAVMSRQKTVNGARTYTRTSMRIKAPKR